MFEYRALGTCCKFIKVELDGKIIKRVEFKGGCDGNLKAINRLVAGHSIDEIIPLLRGNICKNKRTSCADQLTYALEACYQNEQAQKAEGNAKIDHEDKEI